MKIILRVMGILGAIGIGLYSANDFLWAPFDLRFKIVDAYLCMFAAVIISAEMNWMTHPWIAGFGLFLTKYTGRAIFYIFLGGLVLDGYGYIPGIWLLATAVLNIVSLCFCSGKLKDNKAADTKAKTDAPPPKI